MEFIGDMTIVMGKRPDKSAVWNGPEYAPLNRVMKVQWIVDNNSIFSIATLNYPLLGRNKVLQAVF